jgi:hypothetical protein
MDDFNLVEELQASSIYWMLESHSFWQLACEHMDPSVFKGAYRTLFGFARSGHKRHSSILLQEVTQAHDMGKMSFDEYMMVHDACVDIWHRKHPSDDATWESVGRSMKSSKRMSLVNKIIEKAGQRGSLAEFIPQISAVESLGTMNAIRAFNVTQSADTAFAAIKAMQGMKRIGVGNPELDMLMKGGAPYKTLTVFVGMTGVGKSMLLTQTMAHNILMGKPCALVTLELPFEYQAARVVAPLVGMTIDQVTDRPDDAAEILRKLDLPPLWILESDEGTSVQDIREGLRNSCGNDYEVVLIDYLDLLGGGAAVTKADNDYKIGGRATKDLRKWAMQDNIVLFSASQPQRQGKNKKTGPLGTEDLADSQHKSRVSDNVISVNVEPTDDGSEKVYAYLAKFRTGVPRKRTPAFPFNSSYGCVLPNPHFTNIPVSDEMRVPSTTFTGNTKWEFEDE